MSFNPAQLRGAVGMYATVKGVSTPFNCNLLVHSVKKCEFKVKI